MVKAIYHLLLCEEKAKKDSFSCMKILQTIYTMMTDCKSIEAGQRLSKTTKSLSYIKKDDLQILLKTDQEKKQEIEKSSIYIGYKLLWIVDSFL
jgi:hypothetical protein